MIYSFIQTEIIATSHYSNTHITAVELTTEHIHHVGTVVQQLYSSKTVVMPHEWLPQKI